MLFSNDRMSFITEYISAYEQKIKLANKQGLFDAAKMFELFAIEICNLWFGQEFRNLNVTSANYPYVDLISHDENLYVQVSTVIDIPTKVKKTLEKIRDSKNENFKKINKVIFFVLNNESVDNLTDYTGEEQIGNIPFTVKDNLITTKDILAKAENELEFQQNLYETLKSEYEKFQNNINKFSEALNSSKNIGLKNITDLINEEYEIDRNSLVEKIKNDNYRFVSIQGRAGSGKSVICKKCVESEDLVLYARAERFAEESHIDNIWGFPVNDVLECLNGKKIVFFIDALEFIADCLSTKIDLLQYLYEISQNHENVYVITSCRTTDKNAFIKIESNFSIKVYEVNDITTEELLQIAKKYPVINKMYSMNSYVDLLKSPFYINLIVSKKIDIDDIGDENALRDYIWKNIICLKEKSKYYQISGDSIVNTVEKIVFERARNFWLGIQEDEIDSNVLHALISEDVISQQGQYVRLKYDVFEDICFEHHFDLTFDYCKGDYQTFYKEIEGLGRCVYRRYQIWISNKLFIKTNRERFVFTLIFSDDIPHSWKTQTIIGIVKSKYCSEFFEENGNDFFENGLLPEIINITNVYAFEAKLANDDAALLNPVGNGRPSLIKLISNNEYYKDYCIDRKSVTKLCSDYVKQNNIDNTVASETCQILQYYITDLLNNTKEDYLYNVLENISPYLNVIYRIAYCSASWVESFFEELEQDYINGNRSKKRFAEETIAWTLDNAFPELIKSLGDKVCSLADLLYLQEKQPKENNNYFFDYDIDNPKYGLSKNAENYEHSHRTIFSNNLIINLFLHNFNVGFSWAINFINKAILSYYNESPEALQKIQIKFIYENKTAEYWAAPNMWLSGITENSVPMLISDVMYCLKSVIINTLDNYKTNNVFFEKFANYIKSEIYSNSNNIILLTIIEAIGLHFEQELPGYALDLASSIELLHYDTSRYILYHHNPIKDLLEKQIYLAVGMPNIPKRYQLDEKCNYNIEQYVARAQFSIDVKAKEKSINILDYLYSITKNEGNDAHDYLLIQKMDMRNATAVELADGYLALYPNITGEAKKITERQQKINEPEERLKWIVDKLASSDTLLELDSAMKTIEEVLYVIEQSSLGFQYEPFLITLIAYSLKSDDLLLDKRNTYCKIWINRIRKLFSNETYLGDNRYLPILFDQIEKNIDVAIVNEIKNLILDFILYDEGSGIVTDAKKVVSTYLSMHLNLAECIFNTILMLAEDEMNHQKHNARYMKTKKLDKKFSFLPNMQPRLLWVDTHIKNSNDNPYCSKKEAIIDKYLYKESSVSLDLIEIDDYDIRTLCCICNCGLTFNTEKFSSVIREILHLLFRINYNKSKYDMHKIIGIINQYNLIELFQREIKICSTETIIAFDILFNDVDFNDFSRNLIEFYQEIFQVFTYEHFDSYANKNRREICQKKILCLEDKINNIENEKVRVQLYKSLMLSTAETYIKWNECKTSYSYKDKCFLNRLFIDYGKYYLNELIQTIYSFHIDELLPEVLISINNCFTFSKTQGYDFKNLISKHNFVIKNIIMKAYVLFSNEIKQDKELIDAYENILQILIENNYELAAILLDEFRIH